MVDTTLTSDNSLHFKKNIKANHSRIIEQAKFKYSPLGKAFQKQINNWRSRNKTRQVEALKALKPAENWESIKGHFPIMKLKVK